MKKWKDNPKQIKEVLQILKKLMSKEGWIGNHKEWSAAVKRTAVIVSIMWDEKITSNQVHCLTMVPPAIIGKGYSKSEWLRLKFIIETGIWGRKEFNKCILKVK